MKVKDCIALNCPYLQRHVWTQYYRPKGYHAIGMNHAYAYCDRFGCPCREAKECKNGSGCPKQKDKR